MIKLIVSDLDGTLLNSNGILDDAFFELHKKLTDKQIVFCVASGRQYFNLLHIFKSIAQDVFFVAENGTFVCYNNEVLYQKTLARNAVDEILGIAKSIEGIYPVLCGTKSAYMEESSAGIISETAKYYAKLTMVQDFASVTDEVLKVSILDLHGAEQNSLKFFQSLQHPTKVTLGGKVWIDISNEHANKGVAVSFLQSHLGIEANHTLVFGDYLNDLEMLSTAQYSYAMKNAHPEVINKASFITEYTNDEAGVIKKVEELLLQF